MRDCVTTFCTLNNLLHLVFVFQDSVMREGAILKAQLLARSCWLVLTEPNKDDCSCKIHGTSEYEDNSRRPIHFSN